MAEDDAAEQALLSALDAEDRRRVESALVLWAQLTDRLDRLEAKLDALIHAMKAGAVGDWR